MTCLMILSVKADIECFDIADGKIDNDVVYDIFNSSTRKIYLTTKD